MAMHITPDNRLKKLIVIGDRILIKPSKPDERTESGLYLPPGVQEKEKVQQGYVIKTGPDCMACRKAVVSPMFVGL